LEEIFLQVGTAYQVLEGVVLIFEVAVHQNIWNMIITVHQASEIREDMIMIVQALLGIQENVIMIVHQASKAQDQKDIRQKNMMMV
jgi:hypothetical protein